ncbi:hypothetical protein FGO68_gene10305 [Halteria grandinella]|uniref:Uncharacterized protein n=1 Tax=Halteria grandinella TaxID=5974 RepID=A0A8J8T4J8_HALGN|nr:hypothetical protein FGO68_gene10305 [Halteria grandinella]
MARANTPPPRQNLIEVNHHHFQRSSLTPDAKNSLSGGSGRGQYGSQAPTNSAPVDMAKMYQKRTYQDFYNQNHTTANSINRRPPPGLTSNNIATTPLYLPQSNPLQRKRLA